MELSILINERDSEAQPITVAVTDEI